MTKTIKCEGGFLEYKIWGNSDENIPYQIEEVFYLIKNNVIQGTNLYVNPGSRNKGIASKLINQLTDIGIDSIILINAGASTIEYSEPPNDDELVSIAEKLTKFYENLGFFNINDHIGHYEFKTTMIFLNQAGKQLLKEINLI